jgi:hypothetical protein
MPRYTTSICTKTPEMCQEQLIRERPKVRSMEFSTPPLGPVRNSSDFSEA